MKPILFLVLASISLLSCKKEIAPKAANLQVASNSVVHDNTKIIYPVDVQVYVQCTDELVHITGEIQLSYHSILKENGGYHINATDRPLNIRGVGLSSGKIYKYLGHFSVNHNYETKGGIYKVTSRFSFVTPGGGNNLVFKTTITSVTNANGEWVVMETNESTSCR